MSNIRRLPFSEIVERIQSELVRDSAKNIPMEKKYQGVVNDIYTVELPLLLPEDLLRKTGSIATIADYSTGTITVAAAGSTVTGASTVWTSANSNNGLLKSDDEDTVYRVTYSAATTLTLSDPSAWIDDAVSAGNYRLIFDRFALASDFDRIVEDDEQEPEAVYYYTGGNRAYLNPKDNGEYERDFSYTYGTPGDYTVKYVNGDPYLYISPCDDSARRIFYQYIPSLLPMSEYTASTILTLAHDGTAVTSNASVWSDTKFVDTATYDYYFRIDTDGTGSASMWYKISVILTDTTLTLADTYSGTAISSGTSAYTISRISEYPAKYDQALLYGGALRLDPNNQDAKKWESIVMMLLPAYKSVWGKKIYNRQAPYDLRKYM
jgi:hypothetical protein